MRNGPEPPEPPEPDIVPTDAAPPVEYRVDELARLATTTVRNVRAYQDRGLLPPPRRQGRVGLYSDAHLARLRLIGGLLDRGYSLANIAELVGAWEQGQEIGDLLGFEAALAAPWSQEATTTISADELFELVGNPPLELATTALAQAIELGIIEVDAGEGEGEGEGESEDERESEGEGAARGNGQVEGTDGFVVVSPGTLEAGAVLVRAGVPLEAVLALTRRMHADLDDVARLFVDLIECHVIDPLGEPLPAHDIPRVAELVERLRPLAKLVVDAELSRAMDRHIKERFGERIARLVPVLPADFGAGATHGTG